MFRMKFIRAGNNHPIQIFVCEHLPIVGIPMSAEYVLHFDRLLFVRSCKGRHAHWFPDEFETRYGGPMLGLDNTSRSDEAEANALTRRARRIMADAIHISLIKSLPNGSMAVSVF